MFYIYERTSTYIMGGVNKWDGTVRPDHRKVYKTMPAATGTDVGQKKNDAAGILKLAHFGTPGRFLSDVAASHTIETLAGS